MQRLMQGNLLTKIKNFFNAMNEKKAMSEENKFKDSNLFENPLDEVAPDNNVNNSSTPENISNESVKNETAKVNEEITSQTGENNTEKDSKAVEHSLEEVKEEVIKILKSCYDPEIPVDVWELGLIYDIVVATNKDVLIVMTLTSPSCPVAGILPGEIEQKVKEHPMVNDCKVQLTFDPPWSQKMMSEVAKLELGFL